MKQFQNVIIEQFVKVDAADTLKKQRILIYLGIVALGALIFTIDLLLCLKIELLRGTPLTFALFSMVVAFLAMQKFTKRKMVEFEYCFVSGDMSFSRITDKEKRKDQEGFSCENVVSLSHRYDPTAGGGADRFAKIFDYSSSPDSENRWFVIEDHAGAGRYLFIIEPNERTLEALREYIPKSYIQD